MNHLLTSRSHRIGRIEAEKRKVTNYVIFKRILYFPSFIENYEVYTVDTNEINLMVKEITDKKSFITQFLPKEEREGIENIRIYENQELVKTVADKIKVLVFEPYRDSYVKEINNMLESFKHIVEGDIEIISAGFPNVVLVCNEIGMLKDLPQDRGYFGTFFLSGLDEDGNMTSITEQQIEQGKQRFEEKKNFESKSTFLQTYFTNHPVKRTTFHYEIDNFSIHIGSEIVIDFLLNQTNDEWIAVIESVIRDIEETDEDIYSYLKKIVYEIAKKQYKPIS